MEREDDAVVHWINLLKQETECPICLHVYVNPATTACYHTFCQDCITPICKSSIPKCPLCKKKITRRGIRMNTRVKSLVQKINVLVDVFQKESGSNIQIHPGDIYWSVGSDMHDKENPKELIVGKKKCQQVVNETGVLPSDCKLSVTETESNAGGVQEGVGGDKFIVSQNHEQCSVGLNQSSSEVDHVSLSQNIQMDYPYDGDKSNSLLNNRQSLSGKPKSSRTKVKEWLRRTETESGFPEDFRNQIRPSKRDTKLDDEVNDQQHDGEILNLEKPRKLPVVDKYGKRVYKGLKICEDVQSPVRKAVRSTKFWSSPDRVNGVEVVAALEKEEERIPDSCPVEINDTFDKLVSEVRGNDCNKGDSSPEKPVLEAEQGDIALFESLPLPTESRLNTNKYDSRVPTWDEDISNKNVHKNKSLRGKKRKVLCPAEEVMDIVGKNGNSFSTGESVTNSNKVRRSCAPVSTIKVSESDLGVAEKDAKNKERHPLNMKSPSISPPILCAIGQVRSIDNTSRKEKKRPESACASPGWSRLRNAHKDFQDTKKVAALAALDVSGGVPCNTSVSRPHSAKKTPELCRSDHHTSSTVVPPSMVSIDDGISQVLSDSSKQNLMTKKTPMKLVVTKQKATTVTPEIVDKLDIPKQQVTTTIIPLKGTNIDASKGEQITVTPLKCFSLESPKQKPSAVTTPEKVTNLHVSKKQSSTSGTPVKFFHNKVSKQRQSTVKSPVEVLQEPNIPENRGSDSHVVKNSTPMKVCEVLPVPIPSLNEGDADVGVLEVFGKENAGENSFSSRNEVREQLDDGDCVFISRFGSPIRKDIPHTSAVVVKRRTFSLETDAQDLSELANLRESTEDQLEVFRTNLKKRNAPELEVDCQREHSSKQEKQYNSGEETGSSKSALRGSENWKPCNSKHLPQISKEKSLKKKSPRTELKSLVPVLKMGRLTKKRVYSKQGVCFYMLGNVRHCSGAIKKTSEVGVATELPSLQSSLTIIQARGLKTCVDVGVQTNFTVGEDLADVHFIKKVIPIESGSCDSLSLSHSHNVIDGIKPPLDMVKDSVHKFKGGNSMDGEDVVKATSESPGDSLDLIPNTERSGPRMNLGHDWMKSRSKSGLASHHKLKPSNRGLYGRKPVCRLFSSPAGDWTAKEIALPLPSTQMGEAEKEHNFEPTLTLRFKNKEEISLSSDSPSDGENDQIQKNLMQMKSLRSLRNSGRTKGSPAKRKWQCISGKDDSPILGDALSSGSCIEELDSEMLEGKLKLIVANIEADMNVNKKKRTSSEKDGCGSPGHAKDENHCEASIGCFAQETHSLPLTCVAESDSEPEVVKDKDMEEEKGKCLEVDAVRSPSPPLLQACSGEESEYFVEGSQKNVTGEKSIPAKKRPLSIVASGLTVQEVLQVQQLAQIFGHFSPVFCSEGNEMGIPHTTHVVTKIDDSGKALCTFKYLCGIVTGCWIISNKWVSDCLAAGKLLDEEPYEVLGDGDSNGPYLGRNSSRKLFEGLEFFCKEPISTLSVGQLTDIFKLGGGKVVSTPKNFSTRRGKQLIIIETSSLDSEPDLNQLVALGIAMVSPDWVVESIGECRLVSLIGHAVNLHQDVVTASQLREKLLEMGYDEDLLEYESDQSESSGGDPEDD